MRITGGTLKGRTLRAPDGMGTRPTADRVREALFNILAHHEWNEPIENNPLLGARVLDAFAGTGALGIEALSRGASSCVFFEKDRKALACLKENMRLLGNEVIPVSASLHAPVIPTKVGIQRQASASQKTLMPRGHAALDSGLRRNDTFLHDGKTVNILPVDVTRPTKAPQAATLVFLDPPYHKGLIETALAALKAQGWIAPNALLVCETAKEEALALPASFALALERTYGDTRISFFTS